MDEKTLASKHSELLYDYIKFHLGLYIATPPIVAILAEAFCVSTTLSFQLGITGMILAYLFAGAHASWMIAGKINVDWMTDAAWMSLGKSASAPRRRLIHHYLYWVGLAIGLGGILFGRISGL